MSKTETVVWITTRFVGFHRWLKAPEELAFLRNWHRHVFHIRIAVKVIHNDRQIEFFTLKKEVDEHIAKHYTNHSFPYSCEQIAQRLLEQFEAVHVEVSEDGENGALVTKLLYGDM